METAASIDLEAERYHLRPRTPAGARLVELADRHAADAAHRARQHDDDGTFPTETFAEMQESGFLAACIPEELGGPGIQSTVDIAAAFNRLARGDGATAIAAHMHVVTAMGVARFWRENGEGAPAWVGELLQAIGAGRAVICVAGTEPGQTLGWFDTRCVPTAGGYLLTGRKAFASCSPMATHLYVMARVPSKGSEWLNAIAILDRASPGVEVLDDWDALGMRASGSNGVTFDGCFVPGDRVLPVSEAMRSSRHWVRFFVEGNVGLLACFVGIAEAAQEEVLRRLTSKRSTVSGRPVAVRPGVQHRTAEMEVLISTARAVIERMARLTDEFYVDDQRSAVPMSGHHALMKEFQAAKLVSNRAAIDAVDLALTLSGGAGYLSSSTLSRLYRDVRAGPFMQAYSPNEAHEYIGRIALGLDPELVD